MLCRFQILSHLILLAGAFFLCKNAQGVQLTIYGMTGKGVTSTIEDHQSGFKENATFTPFSGRLELSQRFGPIGFHAGIEQYVGYLDFNEDGFSHSGVWNAIAVPAGMSLVIGSIHLIASYKSFLTSTLVTKSEKISVINNQTLKQTVSKTFSDGSSQSSELMILWESKGQKQLQSLRLRMGAAIEITGYRFTKLKQKTTSNRPNQGQQGSSSSSADYELSAISLSLVAGIAFFGP